MSKFNVNDYWLQRGRSYLHEKRTPPEFHRLQERFLLDVLHRGQVPMRRVLELGCGFGRITKLLAGSWPEAEITALDLSPEQLANAREYCGENSRLRFEQYDFYSGAPLPGGDYDTIVAIEVFLHHPPDVVTELFRKLARRARQIVNIDWSEHWPWPTPAHVWVHDYPALYAEAGLRCATFLLPQKVDGKQQKLFVAGTDLPAALVELERKLHRPPDTTSSPNDSDKWLQEVEIARREIMQLIPAGASFILVNDDQWGEMQAIPGRRVIPFLERDGRYWGPPPDDATALRELERLKQSGASHIVFAWSSFWWLEHYAGLRQHLLDACPSVASDRLMVFRLNP